MKVIKQKVLRRISLKYEDFHKIFNLPSERNFNVMMWGIGFKIWKYDHSNLTEWEVEIPYEEMVKNIGLLKGEKILDARYDMIDVFKGYSLIVETNKENINIIKHRLIEKKIQRFFIFKINPRQISFNEWKKIRNIGGRRR